MTETPNNDLIALAEEFKIGQGLDAETHIELLRKVESYSSGQSLEIFNFFLAKENNPDVLLYLVRTVAKFNDISSVDVLSELLLWKDKFKNLEQNPEDYLRVRCMTATVLGNLKDNKAVLPLLYVLNSKDENYKLRLSCAEALGRVGNKYAVAPLIDVVSDEDEKSVYLRESAAKALGMLGDMRAIDPLVSILETKKGLIDKFTFLKERIIESLGRIGSKDERTIKALKNALIDEAPYVRAGAVEALSEVQDDRVIPILEEMLKDEDEEVARTAVNALYNVLGSDYIIELRQNNNLAGWCKNEIDCILEDEDGIEDVNE